MSGEKIVKGLELIKDEMPIAWPETTKKALRVLRTNYENHTVSAYKQEYPNYKSIRVTWVGSAVYGVSDLENGKTTYSIHQYIEIGIVASRNDVNEMLSQFPMTLSVTVDSAGKIV